MRRLVLSVCALALLSCFGCGNGPAHILILSPAQGEFTTANEVLVQGLLVDVNLEAVADVHVNGISVMPVAGTGIFSVTVPLDPAQIEQSIVAEVIGNSGTTLRDKVTLIRGESIADGGFSLEGIALRLAEGGLRELEPLVTGLVPLDVASLVPPGTQVVDNYCYSDTFLGCLGRVDATVSGSPAPSISDFSVSMDSMTNFVAGDVTLSNLYFKVDVHAVTGIGFTCHIDINAATTLILGDYGLSPMASNAEEIDVSQLGGVNVQFGSFSDNTNCDGFLGFIVEAFIGLLISDLQNDFVKPGLQDFLNTPDLAGNTPVAGAIESALQAIELAGPIGAAFGVELLAPMFTIIEDVDGITLKAYAKKNRKLAEKKALGWIEQIADALEYAHGKGFVHRDIKPRNLVLRSDGVVKILDFGLSKYDDDNQELTQDGQLLGTVLYAAPEQLRGAKHVDSRADMYSLGVTLYYILTGEVPFRGETTTATAAMIFEKAFPDVRDKRPDLSEGISKIIERMTRRSPDDRYQTPTQLIADIRLLMEEGRVSAEEPGIVGKKPKASTPTALLLSAAAGLVLAGLLVFASFRMMKSGEDGPSIGKLPLTTSAPPTSTSVRPEPTTTISVPQPPSEFQKLRKAVALLLGKDDFVAALKAIRNPKAEISTSERDDLQSEVLAAAGKFLQSKKAQWKDANASGKKSEVFVAIAKQKSQLPAELHQELNSFRDSLLNAANPAAPEEDPKKIEEPKKETPAEVKPPPKMVAVTPPIPVKPPKKKPETPAGPTPEQIQHEQEAGALLKQVAAASVAKDWKSVVDLLQQLRKQYPKTNVVIKNKRGIAELGIKAATETVDPKLFFRGQVEKLEGNMIEVSYDFTHPSQLEDWIITSGRWRTGPKGLTRLEGGQREVIWWRHPHTG